jgi:hypothetical protein
MIFCKQVWNFVPGYEIVHLGLRSMKFCTWEMKRCSWVWSYVPRYAIRFPDLKLLCFHFLSREWNSIPTDIDSYEHAGVNTVRVARWYIFKPKIPIWVNFGGSCNGRCWYILWPFGLSYGHLVYLFNGYLVYFPRFAMLSQEKSGNREYSYEHTGVNLARNFCIRGIFLIGPICDLFLGAHNPS